MDIFKSGCPNKWIDGWMDGWMDGIKSFCSNLPTTERVNFRSHGHIKK
jgi:hypothetical protein